MQKHATNAPHVVVLIPSLHPDHLLSAYVQELIAHGYKRIVIVDDGSGPEYREIFDGLNALDECAVLSYDVNLGKGHALKHGMAYIAETYPDAEGIVTADSDGQHTASDVTKVAEAMQKGGEGLYLGTRDFSGQDIPSKSRLGNRLTSFFFALLYGHWLPDTQTGLRGFSLDLIPTMAAIPGDRFEYEMNMLIHFSGRHIPMHIVPIQTIYLQENKGTHFRPIRDSARIYKHLFGNFFKYASASAVSTAVDVLLFTLLNRWILPGIVSDPLRNVLWGINIVVFWATLLARVCSALLNYRLNKSLVFRIERSRGSLVRYGLLVVAVMLVSATLVSFMSNPLHLAATPSKIVVDTLLFFANYRIQKAWVFRETDGGVTQ